MCKVLAQKTWEQKEHQIMNKTNERVGAKDAYSFAKHIKKIGFLATNVMTAKGQLFLKRREI